VTTLTTIDRLDNAINPIVVKELRQAVKSRLVTSALLLFLLVNVVALGGFLLLSEVRGDEADAQGGQAMFLVLQGILLGTCMVLIPAYAGIRLSAERSDVNVDLLFISALKPRSIIWGKFVAAAALALLIFSACAPFMTFTYLLRGLDMPTILLVLGTDLLAVLAATMLALFLASLASNRGLKGLLGLGGFVTFVYIFIGAMVFSTTLVEGFVGPRAEEFWAGVGAVVASVVAAMGLLFVWAVALISPPSANRALRVRLYKLFLWLALAAVLGGIAYAYHTPELVYVWMGLMTFLFCLQVAVGINERESWGPRVARTIPQSRLPRVLAFFFYSGAAGGVLFGMVMLGLTLNGGYLALTVWHDHWGPYRTGDVAKATTVMGLIGLYTYCFGMSAVLLRRVLFGEKLKGPFTWVIAVILVALAGALPYAGMLLFADHPNEFEYQHPWVILSNPFISVFQAANPSGSANWRDFDQTCLAFTLCWAGVTTLLALPWYLGQVRRFRPLRATGLKTAQLVEATPNGTPAGDSGVELLGESRGPA
jgi:ABC-type transport system involved in multi-copper enzyme maturation permease subunit